MLMLQINILKALFLIDLIELYESLEKSKGYRLLRANEKIEHVIGELYCSMIELRSLISN